MQTFCIYTLGNFLCFLLEQVLCLYPSLPCQGLAFSFTTFYALPHLNEKSKLQSQTVRTLDLWCTVALLPAVNWAFPSSSFFIFIAGRLLSQARPKTEAGWDKYLERYFKTSWLSKIVDLFYFILRNWALLWRFSLESVLSISSVNCDVFVKGRYLFIRGNMIFHVNQSMSIRSLWKL